MALEFYYGDIEDWENRCFEPGPDGKMKTVTKCLIHATALVGMSRITDKNWREFYQRLYAVERILGPRRTKMNDGEVVKIYFTPEDVREHTGLSTNVTAMNFTRFSQSLLENLTKAAQEELNKIDHGSGH